MEHRETPYIRIDRAKLLRNIERMQHKAQLHGVALRPHAKTHKCAEIARLQIEYGAHGITTSRAEEAVFFLKSGCRSVTVAYPLLSHRRIATLMETATAFGADVRFIADSREGIAALARAAGAQGTKYGVFLKIDTGLHRCGVREDDPDIELLAGSVHDAPGLHFAGLLSHAGHAYAAGHISDIQRIAEDERLILLRLRERLARSGIYAAECSAGSTPTALASASFAGITELRPGNYVFLDGNQVRLGVCSAEDVALSVVATVISKNDRYYIADAGSKTLSSDLGAHGTTAVSWYGTAYPQEQFGSAAHAMPVVRLSEEHGFLQRTDVQLSIGDRVCILPNHACPVVNLAAHLYAEDDTGLVDIWKVGARNRH